MLAFLEKRKGTDWGGECRCSCMLGIFVAKRLQAVLLSDGFVNTAEYLENLIDFNIIIDLTD